MRVKVQGKAIPASFRKIEGRRTLVGAKDQRERQKEDMVGDQNPNPEAPPRSKKGQEKREQGRCQERSDCQRSDVEGWVCQDHGGGGDQKR